MWNMQDRHDRERRCGMGGAGAGTGADMMGGAGAGTHMVDGAVPAVRVGMMDGDGGGEAADMMDGSEGHDASAGAGDDTGAGTGAAAAALPDARSQAWTKDDRELAKMVNSLTEVQDLCTIAVMPLDAATQKMQKAHLRRIAIDARDERLTACAARLKAREEKKRKKSEGQKKKRGKKKARKKK